MKKVILTCGALFLMAAAFAQTNNAPNPGAIPNPPQSPAMQGRMPGEDPMGLSPMTEQAADQAEQADAKGPNGQLLTVDQRTEKMMANLTKRLSLTAAQAQQIRPMIMNSIVQKDDIIKNTKGNVDQARPAMHQINLQRAQMMHQILSPEQWNKYLAMRREMTAKNGAPMPPASGR